MAEELTPLFEEGFLVYHAVLKVKVRVKVGVVACVNDSRAHEKLAWVNASAAKVCCWLCYHRGSHVSEYNKVVYPLGGRSHLPSGHPWRTHPFFGPETAASEPELRTMQSFVDDTDEREAYLNSGGAENGNDDPRRKSGVKGYAEIWLLPGMNDPERLPADFMHSVSLMGSGLSRLIKGQVLQNKKATRADLYEVEKRAGWPLQSHIHTLL